MVLPATASLQAMAEGGDIFGSSSELFQETKFSFSLPVSSGNRPSAD
jgi:hypothetical protein